MFIWLYDPFTMTALFIAYIVSYIALFLFAAAVAPRVASKLSNRFSLYGSMAIAMLSIVVGGFGAIYIIALLITEVGGFTYEFLLSLILFLLIINAITYLLSPYMINIFYGARASPELQQIVNDVSMRAGFSKPPKAVIVDGPPNAFAYGNFLSGRYIAVTTGMLDLVDKGELEAVIGHELGHHKHRDGVILLLLGLFPSVLYYLGFFLVRIGLVGGSSSRERRDSGGGLILLIAGLAAIVFSVILQILVLAFSRLREYYADAHGVYVAGPRNMQRSLAKLHIYYNRFKDARWYLSNSKLKTLFIYAFTEAYASPYVSHYYDDVDRVIEKLKRENVTSSAEIFMSHPPIPKRIAFIDRVVAENIMP